MKRGFCLFLVLGISVSFSSLNIIKHADAGSKRSITGEYVKNQIIVKFKENVTDDNKTGVHASLNAISFRKSYGDHFHVVTIKDGDVKKMIDLYSKNPFVKYAEPNYILRAYFMPNDEFFPIQWHLSQINCEKAWDISTGSGVKVAVVDTGVAIVSPVDNPLGSDGLGGRVIQGHDFVENDEDSSDDNGHGTHVAGTIAQETNNGIGVAGVAFDATIIAVKVLNKRGFGSTDAVIDGIRWAADNGADIINLSLGGSDSSIAMEDAVNEAHDKGVVVIAAAGNESGSVGFPAATESVIAVGSVRFDKTLSFFSNFGPEIDVVAPGGDTSVDQNGDDQPDGVLQETFTRGFLRNRNKLTWNYFFFQGTSQASPHVAGVAALILAKNPGFTPDEVRNVLVNTAEDLGKPGKDDIFGWGLIDALAALFPLPTPTSTPTPTLTPSTSPQPAPQ